MSKWHEYRYDVADTTHDEDGNKMVEITLYIKSTRDNWDVVTDIGDFLEEGLSE